MKSFFNVHNLIKVKVDSKRDDLHEGYHHYLRYFKTDNEITDVNYEVRDFLRSNQSVSFNKENYALSYDGEKLTEYTTYANRATNLWIEMLLIKKGFSFVHAAGAEINGRGFIFPASGGVGKTTLISHLRTLDSFKFFGDDFVILGSGGEMLSYPSDFSIYKYHLKVFNELKNSTYGHFLWRRKYFFWFYFLKKLINFIAKRVHFSSGPILKGWNANYVKVPADYLIPSSKIGKITQLHAAIFLEKYTGDIIKTEPMTNEELIKTVISILETEFKYGQPYFKALYSALNIHQSDFYEKQKEIIESTLSKIKCYKILLPQKLNAKDYFSFVDNFVKSI